MSDSQVTIKLTSDEALVLSHWLEKLQMTDFSRVVDDPAVWAPIHQIAATLDTAVPELFAPDYDQRLEAARQRLPWRTDPAAWTLPLGRIRVGLVEGPVAERREEGAARSLARQSRARVRRLP